VKSTMLFIVATMLGASAFAQNTPQLVPLADAASSPNPYRAIVISRTVQAVNYEHRNQATKVDFAGTTLMPSADGWAKVENKRGNLAITAEFGNLDKPTAFGGEYLTYVMWAISPEGRPVNLGEVLVGGNHRSKLQTTTDLQSFALIITAEPYYAVRQPSNVVVLENVVRADTQGTSEAVSAKYELLERGGYIPTGYKFDPVVLQAKLPLEFFEARNAVRIAQSEGAEEYAGESYRHAVALMNTADSEATTHHSSQQELIATSRQVVQTAEDARAVAVKKIDEARLSNERQASKDTQVALQAQSDAATLQKEQAQAENVRAQADNEKAQADNVNAQAVAARAQSDNAKAQADAAKAQSDLAANQIASATAVSVATADADQAHQTALQAQSDADQARIQARAAEEKQQQAENDQATLRAKLSDQLNSILQTHDSVRGLIVNMSDVLFDTGKYTLKPGAREKLAKVAGILLAYPGLAIEVGGYTDNVGSDAMNQKLSENRADSVRDYLVQQGVATASVTAKGFGNTEPVAGNDDASGRQQNRRVELVVSGESIGDHVTTSRLQ
jgi:outer membrane protein OmpA-like peptidoglycan-associated protein